MKISVVLPTYNREAYLPEAISSILAQTYKDLELVVIDDGSTDDTPTIMDYYVKKDKRVKYLRLPKNKGISYARNYGVQAAQGDFIAVMDSDDVSHPERLRKLLNASKNVDFVYSSYFLADEHATIIATHYPPSKVTLEDVKKNGAWPHVTIMAHKKCFLDNPYRDYRVNDDAFLVWDWFKAGYTSKWVKEPLVIVRTHTGNVSKEKSDAIAETQKILDKEYGNYAV